MRPPDSWKTARVTLTIVALAVAAWCALGLTGRMEWAAIGGGFIPARLAYGGDEGLAPFWLTPLSAAFVHVGLVPLALNLFVLALCGRPVESVLGPVGTALLLLVGAYAAAAAYYALDPRSIGPMFGAAGAVSAVVGAYAILFGRARLRRFGPRLALWLNALWLLAAWIGMQLLVGFGLTLSLAGVPGIAAALAGGFLAGLLLANPLLLLRYRKA